MSYYIYDSRTSAIKNSIARGKSHLKAEYATEGAAKAGITRYRNKLLEQIYKLKNSQYTWDHEKADELVNDLNAMKIAESEDYHANIEQFETVYSIHDREKKNPVRQSVNTPRYLDVSCEAYWCM
jgi:enoyl reductase-like protein